LWNNILEFLEKVIQVIVEIVKKFADVTKIDLRVASERER
jgi:hypothetical protein